MWPTGPSLCPYDGSNSPDYDSSVTQILEPQRTLTTADRGVELPVLVQSWDHQLLHHTMSFETDTPGCPVVTAARSQSTDHLDVRQMAPHEIHRAPPPHCVRLTIVMRRTLLRPHRCQGNSREQAARRVPREPKASLRLSLVDIGSPGQQELFQRRSCWR